MISKCGLSLKFSLFNVLRYKWGCGLWKNHLDIQQGVWESSTWLVKRSELQTWQDQYCSLAVLVFYLSSSLYFFFFFLFLACISRSVPYLCFPFGKRIALGTVILEGAGVDVIEKH